MPRGRFVFAAILILARTALAQGGVAQGSDDVEEGPVESPSRLDNQVIDSAQLHLVPYGRDTRDVESAALSAPRVQRDPFGLRMVAELKSIDGALEAARKGEFDFSPEQ